MNVLLYSVIVSISDTKSTLLKSAVKCESWCKSYSSSWAYKCTWRNRACGGCRRCVGWVPQAMAVQGAYTQQVYMQNNTTSNTAVGEKKEKTVVSAALTVTSFTDLLIQGLMITMVLTHVLE